MTITQKQRLIGAGVLIAIAVIIIPFLIDEPSKSPQTVVISMEDGASSQQAQEGAVENQSEEFATITVANATSDQPSGSQEQQPQSVVIIDDLNNSASSPKSSSKPVTQRMEPVPAATIQKQASAKTENVQPVIENTADSTAQDSQVTAAPVVPKLRPKSKSKPVQDTTKSSSATMNTSGQAWIVQMGSFGQRSNAELLANKLREKGYATYLQDVTTDKGKVTRVNVGPVLNRDQASKLVTELAKNVNMTGVVLTYQPTN